MLKAWKEDEPLFASCCRARSGLLPDLLLDVLRGGFDLDLSISRTGLVARLGEDGRAIDDLAAAQVEAGVVQGADHGTIHAFALIQRTAEVVAGGRDGADVAARG